MYLNKKGYMLVEIIVASVLAMSIAYYLLNLTYRFKNTNEDLYQSYNYMSDKILITKNIMNDLEKGTILITETVKGAYSSSITFNIYIPGKSEESRKLLVRKSGGKHILKYGKYEDGVFDITDLSYYEKELDSSLIIDKLNFEGHNNANSNSVIIEIPIKSIYSDEVYTIKLFANKQ